MIRSKKVLVLGVIQEISMFFKSKKIFSVSKTPSVSSSKVKNIEEELPQRKESICGNRAIDVYPYLVVLLLRCYAMPCVCEGSSLALYEKYEKKKRLSSLLYFKCSTTSCRYICEFFTSVNRDFGINQRFVTIVGYAITWPWLCYEKLNTLMNISKPVTVNNYKKTVSKIIDVVNFVDVVYQRY